MLFQHQYNLYTPMRMQQDVLMKPHANQFLLHEITAKENAA